MFSHIALSRVSFDNVWFQKISIPPEGVGNSEGGGGGVKDPGNSRGEGEGVV